MGPASLPLGPTVFNYDRIVLAGDTDPLTNTVTVTCSPDGFDNIFTASASHTVELFLSSVTIEKTGDPLSKVGDTVNYIITVTNTGSLDSPNLICDIVDPLTGLNKNVNLASGADDVTNVAYVVQAGDPDPLLNTATATCSPIGFSNIIQVSDDHSVELFQPSITIFKTAPILSKVGDPVDYIFFIINTSSPDSPDLVDGTITDTLLGDLLDVGNPFVVSTDCTTTLPTGDIC